MGLRPNPGYNNIIDFLKQERLRQRKSRAQLADKMGHDRGQLGKWEDYKTNVNAHCLIDWINSLGFELVLEPLDRTTSWSRAKRPRLIKR